MPSYYDVLGVARTASPEEIKTAFRREISKYHPDKVQHLGFEFQEIAAVKAAELTQAYRTLSDSARRDEYDAELSGEAASAGVSASPTQPPPTAPQPAATRPEPSRERHPDSEVRSERGPRVSAARADTGDLLRNAAVARFRHVIDSEFGRCDESPVQGFEIACAPPKGRFWNKLSQRILGRFVAHVDAAAVSESWMLAARRKWDDQRELCVFVMGPVVAPAPELARAITEERRKPGGARLTLVPINTRSWSAHIPNDAPPIVKTLVSRLKTA